MRLVVYEPFSFGHPNIVLPYLCFYRPLVQHIVLGAESPSLYTTVGQEVACMPIMQRAWVRSPVGTSFLGGFSSPLREMSGSFRPPKVPEYNLAIIIIQYHSLGVPMT